MYVLVFFSLFVIILKCLTHTRVQDLKKKRKKKKAMSKRKKSMDVGLVSSAESTKDVLDKLKEQEQQSPLPSTPKMNAGTEVDVLGDSILFEANEMHRREFEGFLRSVKDIKDVNNWLKNFSNEAPKKVFISPRLFLFVSSTG